MSYETAPATQLLATFCACCGKELLDAVSIETGMGPVCRKKHGYTKQSGEVSLEDAWVLALDLPEARRAMIDGDLRRAANILVHRIACEQTGEKVARWTLALHHLGFSVLAERVSKRLQGKKGLSVEVEGSSLIVKGPYNEAFLRCMWSVPGQRWDGARKARLVPVSCEGALFSALRKCFPGALINDRGRIEILSA
jgi:hypothetical protein